MAERSGESLRHGATNRLDHSFLAHVSNLKHGAFSGQTKHLHHPSGKHIRVAQCLEEADKLKDSHAQRKSHPDRDHDCQEKSKDGRESSEDGLSDFEIVLHGSPEHVDALQDIHMHHAQKLQTLKNTHGERTAAEFQEVIRYLDKITAEIYHIGDNAAQLDARFSMFGYSAHIKACDSESISSAASVSDKDKSTSASSEEVGTPMRFFEKPIVRQYFHGGLLWRAIESQQPASYETFVDLLYVGIVAVAGDSATESAGPKTLLRFVITFLMSMRFWIEISNFTSWFDSDDIARRVVVLFQLVLLLGFVTNIVECFNATYTSMVAFYIAARLFSAIYIAWISDVIPIVRTTMLGNAIISAIPVGLWAGSIHFPPYSNQALIWTAIGLEQFAGLSLVIVSDHAMKRMKQGKKDAWIDKAFDFIPALNVEHKISRVNNFVTLIFGYSVVSLLYQSRASFGINAFLGKAILGLIQAFSLNWMYFEVDGSNINRHAIRLDLARTLTWFSGHLIFMMSYVISSAALSRLVIAHDCYDAPVESLQEAYARMSIHRVPSTLRWFYCSGLGVAVASMGMFSLLHRHKSLVGRRIGRSYRLGLRFIVAAVLILLPLAERLDSLQVVATTTSLVAFLLVLDLLGSTVAHENIWKFRWKPVQYATRTKISKKDLAARILRKERIPMASLSATSSQEGEQNGLV